MTAPAIPQPDSTPKPIAPVWHTAVFLLALTGLGIWSVKSHGLPKFGLSSRIVSYAIIIALEWLLLALAVMGARMRGVSIGDLIGEKWSRASQFFRDLGISLVFLICSLFLLAILGQLLGARTGENVTNMLPRTQIERVVWIFVALSAGICEELTTRGYLQKQLSGLLKNSIAGLFAQGIVFGAAHAYQGWRHMIIIALLGCMLGGLAQWRKSLLPGVLAHFLQDAVGGILGGH